LPEFSIFTIISWLEETENERNVSQIRKNVSVERFEEHRVAAFDDPRTIASATGRLSQQRRSADRCRLDIRCVCLEIDRSRNFP